MNRTYFDLKPKQKSPFIYFQYDFNPNDKVNLIFGGRFDKYKEYKSQISPKFSGIYKIGDNESIKVSAGYGYKTPDFRQLYFNFSNSTIGYSVIGYNVVEDVLNQLINENKEKVAVGRINTGNTNMFNNYENISIRKNDKKIRIARKNFFNWEKVFRLLIEIIKNLEFFTNRM